VLQFAGFADFGLFFDLGPMAIGELDDLAEGLFVDLAEDVRWQDREFVGAVRVVEAADYLFERFVVDGEVEGEEVGRLGTVLLSAWDTIRNVGHFGHVPSRGFLREVEEAGVVFVVRVAEVFDETRVDALSVHERLEEGVVFDAAIFADTEEYQPVYRALDREVELAGREARVAESDVPREHVAPFLDFGEEGVVNRGRAFLRLGGFDVAVEGAFLDGVGREEA